MRRLVAYILACLTIFLGIGVAFKPVATQINADINYRNGKEITFKLKNREDPAAPIEDEKAATDYAAIMEDRLNAYGSTGYRIATHGYDTITVTLTAANEKEYENIGNLLSVNPKIEIDTAKDSYPVNDDDASFSWHEKGYDAFITYEGVNTVLVKPIPVGAKEKIGEMIKKATEEEGGEKKPEPKSAVALNDDPEPKKDPSIALWLNRTEGEKYSDKAIDKNLAKKITFEFRSDTFYHDANKDSFHIVYTPASNSTTDIRNAYNDAVYHLNILNAAETKYDCEVIRSVVVPAKVENLLIYGEHITLSASATLIATIVAFILMSLVLVLFYRLGSLSIISATTLTTFLTFMFFVLFKPVFDVSALVGLATTFLIGIFIGVAYNHYFHEEVYKGRSLKKANFEASKKSTMLAVDASVISIVLGIIMFFVGGPYVHSFGIVMIIASIVNIFINTFVLKGLMWMVTNSTNLQHNYKAFNIKANRVPDLSKEEKPNYFGPYEGRNLTKRKKLSAIIFGVLTAASLTGVIIFSAVNPKALFNTGDYFNVSNEVRFKITQTPDLPKPIESLDTFKNDILNKVVNDNTKTSFKYDQNIDEFTYEYYDSSRKTNYVDYNYVIVVTESDVESPIYTYTTRSTPLSSLDEALTVALKDAGVSDPVVIKKTQAYNLPTIAPFILLAAIIASALTSIYFWIRYRASRALTLFLTTSTVDLIAIGVIALTRMVASPVLAIAVGFTTLFNMFMCLYVMHKDKDLIRDERVRDSEVRSATLNKALNRAFEPATIFAIVSILIAIMYFGFGPRDFASAFFAATLGSLASVFLVMTLFTPLANFFDKHISQIKLPQIKRKKKKKEFKKSNEPTEATIIGIND